jgi:hypothetical protein
MVGWRGRQPMTNAEFAQEFKDRNQKFEKRIQPIMIYG